MRWEEIERRFVEAGWELDASFDEYLLSGHDGHHVSLLAHKEWWVPDSPAFEILDHETMSTCWVRGVPTPQQAARLLEERGRPPEEWDPPY